MVHHLYFSGTPVAVLALGAVFSALEVVPLSLIGFEAYGNLRLLRLRSVSRGRGVSYVQVALVLAGAKAQVRPQVNKK